MNTKSTNRKKTTQEDNDGHVKIARIEAELKRNPNNMLSSQRLAELKKMHHGKKTI